MMNMWNNPESVADSSLVGQLDELVFELLDPLHQLDVGARRKLLEKSRQLDLAEGRSLLAKEHPWSLLFLLDGSVERLLPGAAPEVVEDGHPDIARPLFPPACPRDTRITARCDCQLILFDRRLFELMLEDAAGGGNQPELVDLDPVGAALFKRLSDGYRKGRLRIPHLDEIASRVLQLVRKANGNDESLHRLVELDPALATRVVQAAGGGPRAISVAEAVRRVGVERVRDIALSCSLECLCDARSRLVRERLYKAHRHSVHVAAYSYVLAEQVGHLDAEHALLCGLLHDVGMFPVLCAADPYMDEIGGAERLDAIVWKLHGMVGGMVLESWGFSREFIATAEEADNWRRNPQLAPDYADVVLVAQLHSFVGTERMKGLPQFSTVPAFRKIAGGEPGPRFSLRVLQRASLRILDIEHMLKGVST